MASEYSILFITDTHIGGDGSGWGHHPVRPDLMPELVKHLAAWAKRNSIDLIVHGGDMIDNGSDQQQKLAKQLMAQFDVPTRLCVGNHDLAQPEASQSWLKNVPELFGNEKLDYSITAGPADIHVIACPWLNENNIFVPWWNTEIPNIPGFTEQQIKQLEAKLTATPDRPAILIVHPSLESLPPELTDLSEPIHPAPEFFANQLSQLLQRHANVKLLLSGHNHATCITGQANRIHMSLSAFCEPPFQALKISITDNAIKLNVFSPVDYRDYNAQFHAKNAWTMGRESDRQAEIKL